MKIDVDRLTKLITELLDDLDGLPCEIEMYIGEFDGKLLYIGARDEDEYDDDPKIDVCVSDVVVPAFGRR